MNKFSFIMLSLFFISVLPSGLRANTDIQPNNNRPIQLEQTPKNQIINARVATIELMDPIDSKKVMFDLVQASRDNEISGVLLLINSHGGRADMFSVLHDLIKKVATMKPVVGLIVGSACSGGYHFASATNYLIAHTASELGNIGIIATVERFKKPKVTGEVNAELDIEIFQAGEFKTIFNQYAKQLSNRERIHVKERINKHYRTFIKAIAKNRGISPEEYKQWADGKSFIASDALRLGLIDEIGTIFEAENKLLELIRKNNPGHTFSNSVEHVFYNVKA